MRSALSLTLIVTVVVSALPVAAQEKTETPMSFHRRGQASQATATHFATAQSVEPPLCFEGPFGSEPIPCSDVQKATSFWVAGERPGLGTTFSSRVALSRRSILTGGLIGFGIGGALGMTVGQEACLHEPRWHCLKVGLPFAAIGALIGWLHK
jgi:hypothetical protein